MKTKMMDAEVDVLYCAPDKLMVDGGSFLTSGHSCLFKIYSTEDT